MNKTPEKTVSTDSRVAAAQNVNPVQRGRLLD
jgi:hypothetical protein